MASYTPTFSIEQFENKGISLSPLTREQRAAVNLVESRVQGQLDWLAQLLGWNGPNYWSNLANTPNVKRQLLTGSFGVYGGVVPLRVQQIQNWNQLIIVDKKEGIRIGQQIKVKDSYYTIEKVDIQENFYALSIGDISQSFYTDFSETGELLLLETNDLVAPFSREKVGTSGDASFVVGSSELDLILYPSFDVRKQTPYKLNFFFKGATYYFDKNVFITFNVNDPTLKFDITSTYDDSVNQWYIKIPDDNINEHIPNVVYLIDTLSYVENSTVIQLPVYVRTWQDPSDWKNLTAIENFKGVWGNKGGFLPFNFCFDALGLHGFDERNSAILPPSTAYLSYDFLLNKVYFQQASTSLTEPSGLNSEQIWWNPATGETSIFSLEPRATECSARVEIDYNYYPQAEDYTPFDATYPTVKEFELNAGGLAINTIVLIQNFANLQPVRDTYIIEKLPSTLVGPGTIVLYKVSDKNWVMSRFTVPDIFSFSANALSFPYGIPVKILNAINLENGFSDNFHVRNLEFKITNSVEIALTKYYQNTTWEITSNSLLKFIANTRLFNGQPDLNTYAPAVGEAWWDYYQPEEHLRVASIYLGPAWVDINKNEEHKSLYAPPNSLRYTEIYIYCNGELLVEGIPFRTSYFTFVYKINKLTGNFEFTYDLFDKSENIGVPAITVSDSLTSEFRFDITKQVFRGLKYYASPNVYDHTVPLRIWKTQALQVVESLEEANEGSFLNPLKADQNSGPSDVNWTRYFLRLPPDYERNGPEWQKVNLICQNFAYFGSAFAIESMETPSEYEKPEIYEEVCLFRNDYKRKQFVYSEPYWYSNLVFSTITPESQYQNAAIVGSDDPPFDDFTEGAIVRYDPLHERTIDTDDTTDNGFGQWNGMYVTAQPCEELSGYLSNDLVDRSVVPIRAPVWDASIYRVPPIEGALSDTYAADTNNFKIGYAYFIADRSAAEDAFFDIEKPISWWDPKDQSHKLYQTPASVIG